MIKKPGESGGAMLPAAGERRVGGSLREALAAAGRTDQGTVASGDKPAPSAPAIPLPGPSAGAGERPPSVPSAVQAVLDARGGATADGAPQTRVVRGGSAREASRDTAARTQLVRGKAPVKRQDFHQDPVVGWLVVVGGAGLGSFRAVFEGNNTIGRSSSQRIAIDFGDETISSEEQAYIRYDSVDRRFLLVPNLAKTNIVAVNDRKPTAAVELAAMDVITMGHTQLVFVPFCGRDFDWGELTEMQG